MNCDTRCPNNKRMIELMSEEELLAYSKFHISLDSQDLINALVARIERRLSFENTRLEPNDAKI